MHALVVVGRSVIGESVGQDADMAEFRGSDGRMKEKE